MAAIRILGIEHLNNRLERMHNIEAVKEAMNKSVLMVHGQAKELCPVDTGNLRSSIHPKVIIQGPNVIGKVYTNVNYAPFVEFGTGSVGSGTYPDPKVNLTYRSTPWTYTPDGGETFYRTSGQVAKPFLYPAIKSNKTRINNIFKEALKNDIRRG